MWQIRSFLKIWLFHVDLEKITCINQMSDQLPPCKQPAVIGHLVYTGDFFKVN